MCAEDPLQPSVFMRNYEPILEEETIKKIREEKKESRRIQSYESLPGVVETLPSSFQETPSKNQPRKSTPEIKTFFSHLSIVPVVLNLPISPINYIDLPNSQAFQQHPAHNKRKRKDSFLSRVSSKIKSKKSLLRGKTFFRKSRFSRTRSLKTRFVTENENKLPKRANKGDGDKIKVFQSLKKVSCKFKALLNKAPKVRTMVASLKSFSSDYFLVNKRKSTKRVKLTSKSMVPQKENLGNKCVNNFRKKLIKKPSVKLYNFRRKFKNLNKRERFLNSTLQRFRKSRKRLRERYKMDSDSPNRESSSSRGGKENLFNYQRRSLYNPRRNSSPNLFAGNVARIPTTTSDSSGTQFGLSKKDFLPSKNFPMVNSFENDVRKTSKSPTHETIKLIDKYLESSSQLKPRKNKSKTELFKDRGRTKSLSMEESVPFSAVRRAEFESFTKQTLSSKEPLCTDKIMAFNALSGCRVKEKYNPIIHSKIPYKEFQEHDESPITPKSSKDVFTDNTKFETENKDHLISPSKKQGRGGQSLEFTDLEDHLPGSRTLESVTASLESMNIVKSKSPVDLGSKQTSDLLQRLDNVLSDLVEEEKMKIEKYEMLKSKRSQSSGKFPFPSKHKEKKKFHRERPREISLLKSNLTSSDIIHRHKEWFTETKPRNPRILKSEIKSKLLSMRCYQPPRHKGNKSSKCLIMNSSNEPYVGTLYSSSSSSCSDTGSQEDIRANVSKYNVEDEWTNFSASSPTSEKYACTDKASQLDDEDDTCYGSDQVSSELIIDKTDHRIKPHFPLRQYSRNGDCSADSAYTESRGATPDLQITGKVTGVPVEEKPNCSTAFYDHESKSTSNNLVQLMNDSKKYLLAKIKESHSYSDNNINKLLQYYSKKWTHIPEAEMKIIIRSIRSDLGVRAPPKECLEYLWEENYSSKTVRRSHLNPCSTSTLSLPLKKELSKEDILADLTATLPEYLKVYQDKRKTLSLSPSPEPLRHFSAKEFSTPLPSLRSPLMQEEDVFLDSRVPTSACRSRKSPTFKLELNEPLNDRTVSPTKAEFYSVLNSSHPPIKFTDIREQDVKDSNDEEWVKNVVGEETFREMETIIKEMKEKGDFSCNDPQDFQKMASELCERFSITF